MTTVVLSELNLHEAAARLAAARAAARPALVAATVRDAPSLEEALAAERAGAQVVITLAPGAPQEALTLLEGARPEGGPAPVALLPRSLAPSETIRLPGPHWRILEPADDLELEALLDAALAGPTPTVIQLGGPWVRRVHAAPPSAGAGSGAVLLEGDALTILACGAAVGEALAAALDLQTRNLRIRVVNLPSLSPLDAALVQRTANEPGGVLVVEEPPPAGLPGLLPGVQACLGTPPEGPLGYLALAELGEPLPGAEGDPDERPGARAIQVAALRCVRSPA